MNEEQIALAILRIVELEKGVVEGAAATTLAACLSGQLPELAGKRVVLLLCGGNIDPNVLSRVIERGLVADGRLSRFTAVISDRPGGLADLTAQIAAVGASIKASGARARFRQLRCFRRKRSLHGRDARPRASRKSPFSLA